MEGKQKVMDSNKSSIIKLIYSALTGEKQQLPEDFSLSEAVAVAKKHGITVMLYYGALNCGVSQTEPLMQELFMYTCKNIAVSEQQMHSVAEIFAAFDKAEIDYMPLKGTLLKKMYPKTEMRSMGDADILVKTAQYEKIKPVMSRLGFSEILESDHELIWNKKGALHLELHKRLIPSYNKDYYAYFGDGWRLAKVKNGTRYEMTDEDQMIYLFTHYAKHYRDAGIGIRHIVDLWVYRKNRPDLDEEYIKTELEALQLYDFYVNTVKTLSVWFEGGEPDSKTDFITHIIFNSGIYGTKEAHILSEAVKISKTQGSSDKVRAKKLQNLIFLPYPYMCEKYPFLKKVPFLLPVMWIVRIFTAILFKRDSIKRNQENLEKMTVQSIDSYQQSLNFVGLDFNFKE